MRRTTIGRAWLLTLLAALTPSLAFGQVFGTDSPTGVMEYAPPGTTLPLPLYSTRPEAGGLYLSTQFTLYRQTNPLKSQLIAQRGFIDVDGTITGASGTFVGSGVTGLDVTQASGPNGYQPGAKYEIGYRFACGDTISVNYWHLTHHNTSAAAGLLPNSTLAVGNNYAESFLTARVFNFPIEYGGPEDDVTAGGPGATYGVWNAADTMFIEFSQRTDQLEFTYRVTAYENECYRFSGLMGPRFFWQWERFRWTSIDLNQAGILAAGPQDIGVYTNIVSNRMYGAHLGCQQEYYLGHGFAAVCELQGALFMDVIKEKVKYTFADRYLAPQNRRTKTDYAIVPELQGSVALAWYPTEGIELKMGYEILGFFNTAASQRPVNFDFGGLDPKFQRVHRIFDGFWAGLAIVF